MLKELTDKYLVVKRSDIEKYVDNSNTRKLIMTIERINAMRHKDGKKQNKKYAVVSETMRNYNLVKDLILSEINDVPPDLSKNEEVQKLVYKAVEVALKAEREKIKKVIPSEYVIITPDPEDETIEDVEVELVKRLEEEEKSIKKGIKNATNKD